MNKQTVLLGLLLSVVTMAMAVQVCSGDIISEGYFAIVFNEGESFAVQDEYRYSTYTFNVVSGNLTGTASLSLTSGLGSLTINPTSTCTITVTNYNPATVVYLGTTPYSQGANIYITSGQQFTITWRDITGIVVGSGTQINLYFRSDSFTTLGVIANGMDTDYTNVYTSSNVTASGSVSISYGFRAWLFSSDTASVEITDGTPQGIITLSSNVTGYQMGTYNFAGHSLTLGYEALKIMVYQREGSGDWTATNTYISNVLLTNYLQSSTWTFRLYVTYTTGTSTSSSYTFGTSDYRSGIENIVYVPPMRSEIQWWRLSRGDLIGFILGSYIDLIGEAFYVVILFGMCGSLYRRYSHFGVVAFFFIMFAGPGGLLLMFVPMWAFAPTAIILILGCVFILWRIIR